MRLPLIEWKEISGDRAALEQVAEWANRDTTRPKNIIPDDYLGPCWAHYGLYVDNALRFCVSVEEVRPNGYKIHADAALGLSPKVTREAGAVILNALLIEPGSRVVAWVNKDNRAARRLAHHFMQPERTYELKDTTLIRYATDHATWQQRQTNG